MAAARSRASRRTRQSKRFRDELRALGLRVRALRTAKDLTLEGASERFELDPTHLAKIEAGAINVTFATLVRISSGLGVHVPDLFRRDR